MSKILAPIDSSNLSELIPEGDDIKFSTQCDVRARQGTTIGSTIAKWKSFVLATASGIALQNRLELNQYKDKHLRYKVRKKKMGLVAEFVPWEEFGTDINKGPPFGRNRIVLVINAKYGVTKRFYIIFKDRIGYGFGHFCRDLWLDKLMK
ncbi:MAG: hypothetical protein KAX18_07510 [Candidatus Lokiarchaeota archaeon]|nr:hypothetical protein [Candidatus Lokiarchaeota archaeon]